MRKRRSATLLVLLLATALGHAQEAGYQVIVNPSNPLQSIDRKLLTNVFLKKTSRWADGTPIQPVDLDVDLPTRAKFTREALGRSVSAVKSYWQQIIFSGRGLPPPELASDQQVVDYVLKHPGGIGYVSSGANLKGAKVLEVK